MLVLVEGVDGSGKTTLIEQLKQLGFKVAKPISRNVSRQFEKWSSLRWRAITEDIVVDRSFVTELVYRTYDGNKPNISLYEICALLDYGISIVYCNNKHSYINSMTRGENNITTMSASRSIERLYNRYISLFKQFSKIKILHYNWETDNVESVVKFIKGG